METTKGYKRVEVNKNNKLTAFGACSPQGLECPFSWELVWGKRCIFKLNPHEQVFFNKFQLLVCTTRANEQGKTWITEEDTNSELPTGLEPRTFQAAVERQSNQPSYGGLVGEETTCQVSKCTHVKQQQVLVILFASVLDKIGEV